MIDLQDEQGDEEGEGPVFARHVHSDQQHGGDEVHALDHEQGARRRTRTLTITCASSRTMMLDDFELEIA